MHKDELLQLHSLLCQVKRFFEDSDIPMAEVFDEYENMEVSPQHIHKSKTDHKRAVFMLGKGLSEVVMNDIPDQQARLIERFQRMSEGKKATPTPGEPKRPEIRSEPSATTDHLPAFAVAALKA
jgi:hypothetical protein